YFASNVTQGTRMIRLHGSNSQASNAVMSASEYYNVGAVDTSSCAGAVNSTTISAGSITPTMPGDLLWQWTVNASAGGSWPGNTSSFAPGTESNIAWQLLGTDLYTGSAVQAGIYNSTSAINPTLTTGTSNGYDS